MHKMVKRKKKNTQNAATKKKPFTLCFQVDSFNKQLAKTNSFTFLFVFINKIVKVLPAAIFASEDTGA